MGLRQARLRHGLRREAQRHAALARTHRIEFFKLTFRPKAVSPLCSATAVQKLVDVGRTIRLATGG